MARLPEPGGDAGQWGEILNDFLSQSISADGSLNIGTVGAVQVKPNAVTTAAIADQQLTSSKLADEAVTTGKIADGQVTASKIADGAVGEHQLGDFSVTNTKLASLGQANGLAPLDADAKLPEAHIPTRLSDSGLNANSAQNIAGADYVPGMTPEQAVGVKIDQKVAAAPTGLRVSAPATGVLLRHVVYVTNEGIQIEAERLDANARIREIHGRVAIAPQQTTSGKNKTPRSQAGSSVSFSNEAGSFDQGLSNYHVAGVPGLEPRTTEPESAVLPITPYPTGFGALPRPTSHPSLPSDRLPNRRSGSQDAAGADAIRRRSTAMSDRTPPATTAA